MTDAVACERALRRVLGDSSARRALARASARGTFARAWPQCPSRFRRRCPKPSAPTRDPTMTRRTFLDTPFPGGMSTLLRAAGTSRGRRAGEYRGRHVAPLELQLARYSRVDAARLSHSSSVRASLSTRKQPYLTIALEFRGRSRVCMTTRAPCAALQRNLGELFPDLTHPFSPPHCCCCCAC